MAQDAGDGTGRQHNEPSRTTNVSVEKKPPQIINEYVGDVFGNILDRYDLPTYNLKLYMIGPGSKNTSAGNPAGVTQDSDVSDGNDARETVANKKGTLYTTGDGYLNNSVTAPPENTVVLAQTGVTEVGIDELEIVTVPGAIGGGTEGSQVNFTITQPNAADFPDQIVKARTYLGAPADAIDCPFFLEVTFRGRKESNENMDDWDMDKGGELVDISGPFVYTLLLKNFSMSIDQSGSTYQFQTVMKNDTYTADTFFRTRKFYTISGRTIGMMLKDLETQTNEYNEKEEIIDRISFGLDDLGEKDFSKEGSDKVLESRDDYFVPNFDITDQSLDIDNAETIAKITKLEVTEAKDTEEATEESEETPDKAKSSSINKNPETNNITLDLKEGITMDRVLGIILSMNKEFMQKFRAINQITPVIVVPSSFNSVTIEEFQRIGVNIVIYANHMLRAAYPAMLEVAESILINGRSQEAEAKCMPIKDILEFIPGTK